MRRFVACHDRIVALALVAALASMASSALAKGPGMSLESFLEAKGIGLAERGPLIEVGPWSEEKDRLLVRVLARMAAPPALAVAWREAAVPVATETATPAIGDRFVRARGRAIFVAPWKLPPAIAAIAGRSEYDLVRIVDEGGAVVDVVTPRAARAWKRWAPIDEPAAVVGLPLTAAAGPEPVGERPAVQRWPAAPHDLLVAATGVEWFPPSLLGRLGMNHALFDGVVDDRKLEAGDTDAFWDVMAAARRTTPAEIAKAVRGTTDIIPLIDPAQRWFVGHRGDPVVIEGVARKVTRIAVDAPDRRVAAGDHYFELEVFVDTPPIKVHDRIQDRYPIVCCVASLPPGMPAGEDIGERVRVPGFAFKRYSYPLQGARAAAGKAERLSTPLVIGPGVEWKPPPSPAGLSNRLFGIFAGILGALAALLGFGAWSASRGARRAERIRREALPDRLELPDE
jgi:hypothetical protein